MNQSRRDLFILLTLAVVTTLPFWLVDIDLGVAGLFYDSALGADPWPLGTAPLWRAVYRLGPYLAWGVGGAALAVLVLGFVWSRWHPWRREAIYLVLCLALGPGLVVNVVFKDHWGRPRPRQVQQFGGTLEFLPVLVKGASGQGKSFPSGHSAVGFSLTAGYFLLRRRRPVAARAVLAGSLGLGGLLGVARLAAGGHFLSDILWSAYLPALVNHGLYYYVLRLPAHEAGAEMHGPRWARPIGGAIIGGVLAVALFARPCYEEFQFQADPFRPPEALTLEADRTDVRLVFDPALKVPLQMEGSVRGYGMPSSRVHVETEGTAAGGPIRYRIQPRGVYTDLESMVTIRVPPSGFPSLHIHLTHGEIALQGSPDTAMRDRLDLSTDRGPVLPPQPPAETVETQ